jgi:hypothetical protein
MRRLVDAQTVHGAKFDRGVITRQAGCMVSSGGSCNHNAGVFSLHAHLYIASNTLKGPAMLPNGKSFGTLLIAKRKLLRGFSFSDIYAMPSRPH